MTRRLVVDVDDIPRLNVLGCMAAGGVMLSKCRQVFMAETSPCVFLLAGSLSSSLL
jgi:hypothetical protein